MFVVDVDTMCNMYNVNCAVRTNVFWNKYSSVHLLVSIISFLSAMALYDLICLRLNNDTST